MSGPSRLWFAGIAAGLIMTSPLRGQEQPAHPPVPTAPVPVAPPAPAGAAAPVPDQQSAETLGYEYSNSRMTIPVNIHGRGPYHFIVDTGAERSVISRELARTLELAPGAPAILHSMTEVSRVETVLIPELQVGGRRVSDINAPALERMYLGAAGILGVDSLQRQRVVFDFQRREMTISPSRRTEENWPEGQSVVVTGRSLFGRLVLIDAEVDGQRVWVIVDSGSEVSVANNALRNALARRHRLGEIRQVQLISVTGGRLSADYTIARKVRIGGVDIVRLPIAFADVHPFRQLGLMDRPALLLGMDALSLFDRVSVDFANRRVRVLLDDSSRHEEPTRMASVGP